MTISKICHIAKYRKFGIIEASNVTFVDDSLDVLHNDHNLFTFYECKTVDLIYGDLQLPWQATGMAYNDFIVIENSALTNWQAQNINNYAPLKSSSFLQNLANCLVDDNESYKAEIATLNARIVTLQNGNNTLRRRFAVCLFTLCFVVYVSVIVMHFK